MKAILFGSIGTVVETSDLQRKSFNEAFSKMGLDWHWDLDSYKEMLSMSGGAKRIERYAQHRGQDVDAGKVHALKTEIFQKAMKDNPPPMRDGVEDTIAFAKEHDMQLGFVSCTEEDTVHDIATMVMQRTGHAFDLKTWRTVNRPGKPDPAVYLEALDRFGLSSGDVLAIEDNKDGVASAQSAGIFTLGYPGALTVPSDLDAADVLVTDRLFEIVRDQTMPPAKKVG